MSLILLGNIGGGGTGTSGPITASEITDATAVGKAVVTAADAAAARAALGAGTGSSDLALGTTSSTAMPGNKTAADLGGVPAARTVAGLPLSGDILAVDLVNALPAATTTAKGPVELATTAEATTGTDDTRAVTPAGVAAVIALLTSGAPGLLNTLAEIDAAIGNDPNFATTMTTALAGKVPITRLIAGLALNGDITAAALTAALSAATTTANGTVELATNTETVAGSDTSRAVTPAGLAAALAPQTAGIIGSSPFGWPLAWTGTAWPARTTIPSWWTGPAFWVVYPGSTIPSGGVPQPTAWQAGDTVGIDPDDAAGWAS